VLLRYDKPKTTNKQRINKIVQQTCSYYQKQYKKVPLVATIA
jgi:hypothetical protein